MSKAEANQAEQRQEEPLSLSSNEIEMVIGKQTMRIAALNRKCAELQAQVNERPRSAVQRLGLPSGAAPPLHFL